MNQEQFLEELAQLLQDIPKEEREEALDYYRCYFEDAGIENEASVLKELGSPKQVADSLKRGMEQSPQEGEYTETGYQNFDDRQMPVGVDTDGDVESENCQENNIYQQDDIQGSKASSQRKYDSQRENTYQKNTKEQQSYNTGDYEEPESVQRHNRRLRALLFLPFWIIAIIIMVCIFVAVVVAVVGVAIGLAGGVAGFASGGIFSLVVGSGVVVGGFSFAGIGVLGIGLLGLAVAVLLLLALVAYCRYVLPKAIRGICRTIGAVVRSISGRR